MATTQAPITLLNEGKPEAERAVESWLISSAATRGAKCGECFKIYGATKRPVTRERLATLGQ